MLRTLALALACGLVAGQQSGTPARDYVVNGAGSFAASPVAGALAVPGLMQNAYSTQDPGVPLLWIVSPNNNPGQATTGTNTVDIGTFPLFGDVTYLLNGTAPGLAGFFWNTDPQGQFVYDVTVGAGGAGVAASFCFAHFAATSPDGWWISQTHEVSFFLPQVLVEAVGANSYDADPAQGFWRATHLGNGPPVVDLVLDWTAATAPIQAAQEFDCDQIGMSDVFVFGSGGLVPGSAGTYRNGSDLACGLVYDALCSHVAFSAGGVAGGNCGFIGLNAVGAGPSYRTLRFRFAAPAFALQTFEFDADTDGGPVSGGGMAGLGVVVTLADQSVLTGALAADPADPDRAFLLL